MPGRLIGGDCCCCPKISVPPTYTTIARYNLVGDLQEVWDTGWDTHAIDLESGNLLAGGANNNSIGGFVGRSHLTLFNETAPAGNVIWLSLHDDDEIEYTSGASTIPTSRQRYDFGASSTVYNLSGGGVTSGRFDEGKFYAKQVGSDAFGAFYRPATVDSATGAFTEYGPSYVIAMSNSNLGVVYGLRGPEVDSGETTGYIQFPGGAILETASTGYLLHCNGNYCVVNANSSVELWQVSSMTKIWDQATVDLESDMSMDPFSASLAKLLVDSTGAVFVWYNTVEFGGLNYAVLAKLDASTGEVVWFDKIPATTTFNLSSAAIGSGRISIVYGSTSSKTLKSYSTGDSLSSWTGISDVYDVQAYNANIYVCGDRRLTSSL